MPVNLICPDCEATLRINGEESVRCVCGGLDFLRGNPFHDFDLDPADPGQAETLRLEAQGVAERVESFLVPALRRYCACTGRVPAELTLLDCGCGGGLSIDLLREAGFDAWGIDAGRSRHRQWQERASGPFLHSADALQIPFQRNSFDIAISCGLIEHIGIYETMEDHYVARRLADCDERRTQFARHLLRVTREDGFILLDHPNGSFPIDFWHGGPHGGFRVHRPWGDMLPRFSEISHYFRSADPNLEFLSLSPVDRLRLGRVRRLKLGPVLAPLIRLWFDMMSVPWLASMARGCLNPYLVTVIYRGGLARRTFGKIFQ